MSKGVKTPKTLKHQTHKHNIMLQVSFLREHRDQAIEGLRKRNYSDDQIQVVDQAIAKKAKVIWMQEGIVHNAAAEKARAAGLRVVMNKCLYKEHARL